MKSEDSCRLCLQNKKLRKSHIIPEFFYKPVYEDPHRLVVLPNTKNARCYRNLQKGLREKLLCEDCEQLRSVWERYIREVFFGESSEILDCGDHIRFRNLDYAKLKLFGLSLIWLASISSEQFFSYVNLQDHDGILRSTIQRQEPGDSDEYGFMITAMSLFGKSTEDVIMQPDEIAVDGHRCVRFVLGSCLWLFVLGKAASAFPLRKLFLQKNGTLIVPRKAAEDMDLFQRFAAQVLSSETKRGI